MIRNFCFAIAVTFLTASLSFAQTIPTPKEHFGFAIGDDYKLANYTQTEAYIKKLAAASNRAKMVSIGLTEEGRQQFMLIVSSPENLKNLDHYKTISQKLGRAEGLTDAEAEKLAEEGKAIVWIDGGLHANEVVGAHQLIETIYQFLSRNDDETLKILENTIILFVHANPDGQELMSNWYMMEEDEKKRNTRIPKLYQKYIGHDNNRDFYMMNMKETQNISRQQYIEWIPQIIYNHHQTGPPGSVVAGPPYRDPFNYVYDPLVVTQLDGVGAAMNSRLNKEDKPGYTQKSGSQFSTWWNGGLRTTAYFHNIIGILTEIVGSPTPSSIPLVPNRLIPNSGTPYPVTPQPWKFRQSIDYSVSLNYAVLNYAANQKEELLFNIYRMGKNAIEKGNKDNWTLTPKYIDSINNAWRKDQPNRNTSAASEANIGRQQIPAKYYDIVFKDPTLRDARAYIIPANQPDFATAVKFLNALIYSGVQVHKATAPFTVEGKSYPAGSYVVKTAQAFRPHVMDMFEPQDHPNDFQYPGGPPVAPYDAAGWTLAYLMGIKFDRILTGFEAPLSAIPYGQLQSVKGVVDPASVTGYILNAASNNSFIAVNHLLKQGIKVYRIDKPFEDIAAGSFYIPSSSSNKNLISKYASDLGIVVQGINKKPSSLSAVKPSRIALWDTYGGSMTSGWIRWILEQYQFPFDVVYANEIDKGDLKKKYDVIIFPDGAIPAFGRPLGRNNQPKPEEIPAEYRERLGRITPDTTLPQIKEFLKEGGNVIAIGSSTNLAYHLNIPVSNALVEINNGQERNIPREKFYIPGSILRVAVDTTIRSSWGLPSSIDVYFDDSPVFNIKDNNKVKPIVWYPSDKTLRSGWAWGQAYLNGGIAAFEAPVGDGKLFAFGPEITFRGQAHGTFKFLFNQLYK